MNLPTTPPSPLEHLCLPSLLDGANGTNRQSSRSGIISADNDLDAVRAWLARYQDSPATFSNYRKEAERLLLWSTLEQGKPLSSLTHEDLLRYQHFLNDPQPAERWVGQRGRKVGRQHPDWRPFAGPLSASSQRQTLQILNALFSWLVQAGYLQGNPLMLARQRRRHTAPRITRLLTDELWLAVKETLRDLPETTPREQQHKARLRWLFSLLYSLGLRISEVCNHGMQHFFARTDAQGQSRWWLEITGKGEKTRLVPVSEELMEELARYRRFYQLPPAPVATEQRPLILTISGKDKPLTRAAVHTLIKEVFRRASERLAAAGKTDDAAHLQHASAHWLRHTAGSRMADANLDLRHIRDNLGHSSLNTTSIYLHSADDLRHQNTQEKHRINWD